MRYLLWCVVAVQAALALRVFARMARTREGQRIARVQPSDGATASVSIIVPVLDERDRLGPCLDGLRAQGDVVREIIVVDGGSQDGTQQLVCDRATGDARLRLVDASPVPPGVNGKSYGLMIGSRQVDPDARWLLTIDADVRLQAGAVDAVVGQAERTGLNALSVATTQRVTGNLLGLLHPSMLTTLVYRFGIPGHAARRVADVQANGQCFLVDRTVLRDCGGFESVLGSIAEDVTLARAIVEHGEPVGFFENDGLIDVEMHASARDAWQNWPRSLPLRDRYASTSADLGLAEVLLVQAAPPYLLPLVIRMGGWRCALAQLQVGLIVARLGVLVGVARAYRSRPLTYWLAPLADMPVALELIRRSRQRSHVWRGRVIAAGDFQ